MSQRRFEPGTVLADKYRLDALLGEGGMGTVYQATHLLLKAPVAIKVIDREVSSGDVALARFMREAQAAASLRSPHVVQVLDYGSAEGSPFMVMELLEGENLAQRIERVGRLAPRETYRVMSHVARAVAKAHEAGIVHRDLKPDNVFLVHNEGDQLAKVLDFGVAKVEATALGGGSHTRTGSLLGTPYYMSPEQAQGNKEVDFRSDLWALGVIAFECLTGKRPFFSDGLGDIVLQICVRDIPRPSNVSEVPAGFDDWFAHATQRDPNQRFQSARELSEALREALDVGREPNGSVPESQWSAPSLPNLKVSSAPNATDATTERDLLQPSTLTMQSSAVPSQAPEASIPDETANHRVVVGERGARWEESVRSQATEQSSPVANWRVVPIGPSDRPPSAPVKSPSEPAAPERSKGWGVFLVALAALSLGAALVLLAREYGSDFLARTLRRETHLSAPKAKKAPSTRPGLSGPVGEAAGKGEVVDAKAKGTSTKSNDGSRSGGTAATKPDGEPTPAGEDEALDALEQELEKTTGDQPAVDGEAEPSASEGEPTPSDAPKPEVPEGLLPPPPPPPPTQAPAPGED
jgi:serine/threonine protein kinase